MHFQLPIYRVCTRKPRHKHSKALFKYAQRANGNHEHGTKGGRSTVFEQIEHINKDNYMQKPYRNPGAAKYNRSEQFITEVQQYI